jgi:hypothetical protein
MSGHRPFRELEEKTFTPEQIAKIKARAEVICKEMEKQEEEIERIGHQLMEQYMAALKELAQR